MPTPLKPNALKELEGTDRADRHREEIPLQLASDISPPPNLIDDPEALRLWNEYAPALVACNVLAEVDKNALAIACGLGAILYNQMKNGDAPNAAITTQWRMLMNEFGLTSASRSKPIPLGNREDKDPTAEYFAKPKVVK